MRTKHGRTLQVLPKFSYVISLKSLKEHSLCYQNSLKKILRSPLIWELEALMEKNLRKKTTLPGKKLQLWSQEESRTSCQLFGCSPCSQAHGEARHAWALGAEATGSSAPVSWERLTTFKSGLNEQRASMQFYSTRNVRCGLMNKPSWRDGTELQEGSGGQIWYKDTAAQQLSAAPPLTLGKRYSPFIALQQQRGLRMRLQGSTLVQNR